MKDLLLRIADRTSSCYTDSKFYMCSYIAPHCHGKNTVKEFLLPCKQSCEGLLTLSHHPPSIIIHAHEVHEIGSSARQTNRLVQTNWLTMYIISPYFRVFSAHSVCLLIYLNLVSGNRTSLPRVLVITLFAFFFRLQRPVQRSIGRCV